MCGWDRCPGSERRVVTDSRKEHTLFGGTRAGVRLSAPTAIKAGVTASGLVCPPHLAMRRLVSRSRNQTFTIAGAWLLYTPALHFRVVEVLAGQAAPSCPSNQVKARRTTVAPSPVGRSPCAISTRSIGQARTLSSEARAARRLRKLARQSLGVPGLGATIPPRRARNPRHPLNQSRGKFWIRSANRAVRAPQ